MNINRNWVIGSVVIAALSGYLVATATNQEVESVYLESKDTKIDDGALQRKVHKLERELASLRNGLKSIRILNEDLITRLEQSDEANGGEALADGADGFSFANQHGYVDGNALMKIAKVVQSDQASNSIYNSYLNDIGAQREAETEHLFNSRSEDVEWSNEANDFLSQKLKSTNYHSSTLDHVECRKSICKVEFSADWDESVDSGIQETEILLELSDEFPNTRLSQSIENGRVKYSGYLTDGSVELPEAQHFLSDGRLSQDELETIKVMLNM